MAVVLEAQKQAQSLRSASSKQSSKATEKQKEKASKVPAKKQRAPRKGLFSISQGERIFFIDNVATLLQAGMPLSVALGTLAAEAKSRALRKGIDSMKHIVDNGGQFSDSLKQHPEIFPPLYVAVVEVGEAGGSLAEVMERLAETAKKAKALRSKMINAMIYPIIVIVAIIAVITVLMIYVFPQLISIFEEVEVELPIQTRILITTVEFLQVYGLYILGGLGVFILFLIISSRFRKMRKFYHRTIMTFPLIGRTWKEVVLIRILGNLKMLMTSGVPIVQAFKIASRTSGNLVYEDALISSARELELGQSIHEVLQREPKLFTSLVSSMARVGEETGKFDEILGKLEEYYSGRVDNVFSNLSSIIEPFLLLAIGVVVGFIAVSVIMPIYNLAQSF